VAPLRYQAAPPAPFCLHALTCLLLAVTAKMDFIEDFHLKVSPKMHA
jgi:hypothetical protein